jgi:hypothetical protein
MEVPPIFDTNRIHCFYDEVYDLLLLPKGASRNDLIRQNLPNANKCVGSSNIYDSMIKKYKKNINFKDLRNLLANGKDIPLSDITLSYEEKDKEAHNLLTLPPSIAKRVEFFHENMKRNKQKREKLLLKNAPPERIQKLDRIIDYETKEIENLLNRKEKRRTLKNVSNSTMQKDLVDFNILKPLFNNTAREVDDSESEEKAPTTFKPEVDDSESEEKAPTTFKPEVDDSESEEKAPTTFKPEVDDSESEEKAPTNSDTYVPDTSRFEALLSDAREALLVEQMGDNRPHKVQQLKATISRLENILPLYRQDGSMRSVKKGSGAITEDNIFDHLKLLQWRDKDEIKMSIQQLNKIPIQTLNEMFPIMQTLATNLRNALASQTGAIEAMEEDDRNNFLFHVIAKGKDIYYQSLCEADFCLYMLDTWQPLYTFICKKLKRNA